VLSAVSFTGGIGITASVSGSSALTTRKVVDVPKLRRRSKKTTTGDDDDDDDDTLILKCWYDFFLSFFSERLID
jgi:hypothetical protein